MSRACYRPRTGRGRLTEGRRGHSNSALSRKCGSDRRAEINSERRKTSSVLSQQRGLVASEVDEDLHNEAEAKRAFQFDRFNW